MKDANGVNIRTGMVVRISGAFHRADNGLYFVIKSPKDPLWREHYHALRKIDKSGKLCPSTRDDSIGFWPIRVCAGSKEEEAEAGAWNAEHAKIEVVQIDNTEEVKRWFLGKSVNAQAYLTLSGMANNTSDETTKEQRTAMAFYERIAASMEKTSETP